MAEAIVNRQGDSNSTPSTPMAQATAIKAMDMYAKM
jgi:hypothetical protein